MKITNKQFFVGAFAGFGLGILAAEAWALNWWKELAILICLVASIARYHLWSLDRRVNEPSKSDDTAA
jgi:hypothetical protein